MAELVQLGKESSYEGQKLREWVTKQPAVQRADRAAEPEAEKARAEVETEKVRVEAEKAMAEAEAGKVRVEAEKARTETEAGKVQIEANKETELKNLRQGLEKEKLELSL